MIRKAAMFVIGMALVIYGAYADPTARVTGGNSIGQGPGHTIVAFSLSCDGSSPNNLMLKWDAGSFKLQSLIQAQCSSNAGVFTYTGSGYGELKMDKLTYGVPIYFTLTDDGSVETANIVVSHPGGIPNFLDASITLDNLQYHNP